VVHFVVTHGTSGTWNDDGYIVSYLSCEHGSLGIENKLTKKICRVHSIEVRTKDGSWMWKRKREFCFGVWDNERGSGWPRLCE
jgi:hypothetical protein